jgi:cytochrome oxidase Cu insertion factor (SCO1/SenC/PrrC family)
MKTCLPGVFLVVAMIVSACGGARTTAPDSGATTVPTEAAMLDQPQTEDAGTMTGESMATGEAMMGDQESTTEAMTDQSMGQDEEMAGESMATAEPMMGNEGAMAAPGWFGVELTDVNSGQAFKVSDFKGKVVLVETMAVWCTTCLSQQQQIQALHTTSGQQDGLVSLSIDIDPNEDAGILKSHAEGHGFDWLYAVAPREVAREVGQLYGDQFLNPPSAPMFIIDRQGQTHPLPFGVKSAAVLQEALSAYLN